MDKRGNTLLTTLVIVSLGFVLLMGLSGSSLTQLHLTQGESHRKRARSAAESVLAEATEVFVTDDSFGTLGDSSDSLELQFDESTGRLTFHPATANDWGIPVSVSNRVGEEAVRGWEERVVPARAVQVVAVGRSGPAEKVLEAVIHFPDFPFAMASSGPIESEGGLIIGGVESVENALTWLEEEELAPADLVSNADGQSVRLEGQGKIAGSVKAAGEIFVSPDVVVDGELHAGADRVSIKTLDFAELKPKYSSAFINELAPTIEDESVHFNDPALSIRGGLTLEESVLFVNGDLTIRGGVRGRGAIIVNGKLHIQGGSSFVAENQVAVVAREEIRIEGSSSDSSYFQGLMYTEGDFEAENITLVGTFVANRERSATNPGSVMRLKDVRVAQFADFSKIETGPKYGVMVFGSGVRVAVSEDDLEYFHSLPLSGVVGNFGRTPFFARMETRDGIYPVSRIENEGAAGGPGESGSRTFEAGEYGAAMQHPSYPNYTLEDFEGEVIVPEAMPHIFEWDYNEFLSAENKVRIVFWKEH